MVTLTFTAVGATSPTATPIVTIDDDETQSFVWIPAAPTLKEGGMAEITLRADPLPVQLTHTVTLAVDAGYATRNPADDADVSTHTFTATGGAGAPEVALLLKAPANDGNRDDDMITLQARGTTVTPLAELSINVADIHGLPVGAAITATAYDMMSGGTMVPPMVDEGDKVYLEVMVDRGSDGYPMGEALEVELELSDSSLGTFAGDEGTVTVTVPAGTGEQKAARVELTTVAMNSIRDGMLVVSLTASGTTAANGPVGAVTGMPYSLTITSTNVPNVTAKMEAEIMKAVMDQRTAAAGSDGLWTADDPDLEFTGDDFFNLPMAGFAVSVSPMVTEGDSVYTGTDGSAIWVGANEDNMPGTSTVSLTAVVSTDSVVTTTQNSANSATVTFDITLDAPAAPVVTAKSDADVMAAYMEARTAAVGTDGAWASNDGPATIMLDMLFDNLPATGVSADATSSMASVVVASVSSSSGLVLTPVGAGESTVTVTANGVSVMFMVTVDAIPVPGLDTRGRITAFSIAGTEEKTLDGVKRMHLTEGGITTATVTVTWTNQQLTALWDGYTAANPPPPAMVALYDTSFVEDAALGRWLSLAETNERDGSGSLGGNDVVWGARDIEVKIPKKPTKNTDSATVTASATGTTSVSLPHDDDAEPEAFRVSWSDVNSWGVKYEGALMYGLLTATTHVIEDDEPQGIKLTQTTKDPIYEGGGTVTFTAVAAPTREDLPLDIRYDLTDSSGVTVSSGTYTVDSSIGTIPVGPSGKDTVVLNVAGNDGNRMDDMLQMHAEVVTYALDTGAYGDVGSKMVNFTVIDVHKLPPVTVMPETATLMEGKELELTVTVDRNPRETRAVDPETLPYTTEELSIAVMASGATGEYSLSSTAITVPEYKHTATTNWLQPVKVTVEALMDEDVEPDSMLMLDFVVNGTKAANGPSDSDVDGQASVTIQDATATLVSVRDNAYDVIQGALGTPPTLTTGMSAELMGANLFDYDASAVSVAYATSVEGAAVTASASGGAVTIMAASAGEAKVTITATATPNGSSLVVNQTKSNVAQLTFPVMVEDPPLTFTVMGPDEMNLSEGGMGGMVKVMTNRAVSENTEVMLMRDGSSSASDDDYMLDPPLVTIMAGMDEGHTMVMAVEDNMAEEMEMLTLFLVVDGMQMSDQSVSFYLWDAAVPALPVIAQLLLAAFLGLGGYRRYLRRR